MLYTILIYPYISNEVQESIFKAVAIEIDIVNGPTQRINPPVLIWRGIVGARDRARYTARHRRIITRISIRY